MKIEKVEKPLANLHENEYVIHKTNLKHILNHELNLTELHRIIEFKQKFWLKSYIDVNTDLRKKSKKWFWKRYI